MVKELVSILVAICNNSQPKGNTGMVRKAAVPAVNLEQPSRGFPVMHVTVTESSSSTAFLISGF